MDRAEFGQAHYGYKTSGFYKFRQNHSTTLDIRIPEGSGTTRGAYYLLQLWQGPGLPPIAGIRMKRGTSHTLQFIARSYAGNVRKGNVRKKADVITQFDLNPGSWHRLSLRYMINPRKPGFFNVNVDGVNIGRFEGRIGSSAKESVIGFTKPPQSYRVKFGIYKQSESALFQVDYDNITLG
jgi:hypothetical protein